MNYAEDLALIGKARKDHFPFEKVPMINGRGFDNRGCYSCTYRVRLGSTEKCRMTLGTIPLNIANGEDCLYWIRRKCGNCSWSNCDETDILQKPEDCSQYLFASV